MVFINLQNSKKKSQGEIFGIALLFVIIIIGVIIYGKIKMINDTSKIDLLQEGEYKILSEGALSAVLKMSVGCEVERGRDSVKDLINFCLENEYAGIDPSIECENGEEKFACAYVVDILNNTMKLVFNSSEGVAMIPYELKLDIPSNQRALLANKTFTNFGSYKYRGEVIDYDNRRRFGFKRAPSGLISWASSQRSVEFELYLYYK